MRHFLSLFEVGPDDILYLLHEAVELKAGLLRGERPPVLAGRVLGLVFEKPSLRTRVSFEAGMAQLGGSSVFLSATDGALGKREPVADFARTLAEYADAVVLRVFEHRTVEEFARLSRVPVINGLSDQAHPCQALGDLLTMYELFGDLRGRTLAFIGDGNNVARSLALACGLVGMRFILAAPPRYAFDADFLASLRQAMPTAHLAQTTNPQQAVAGADIVYTDVWTSMGQEAESAQRLADFKGYAIDAALMARSPAHCRFMHCLPARRGEEVTHDVMEGPRSVVFQQAGNRMHAQKALLKWLITEQGNSSRSPAPPGNG
jgi:ornithine carbamoyltransferase